MIFLNSTRTTLSSWFIINTKIIETKARTTETIENEYTTATLTKQSKVSNFKIPEMKNLKKRNARKYDHSQDHTTYHPEHNISRFGHI